MLLRKIKIYRNSDSILYSLQAAAARWHQRPNWPWNHVFEKSRYLSYFSFNNVDSLHYLWAECCMLYCRECGPMAAVGWRWPPWSSDATIRLVVESSPPAPFPPPSSPPLMFLVGGHGTQLNDRFGMVVAKQDGSDPYDDAHPQITGGHCQSFGTNPYIFLCRQQENTKATSPIDASWLECDIGHSI